METQCIADFEEPWSAPNWDSSLIDRCRTYWSTPIGDLPDFALAMFLDQRIAMGPIVKQAQLRVETGVADGSEMFDGQLFAALRRIGRDEGI